MTLAPWREGSFEIATQDGQFIVNGFVSEEFGIRDAGRRYPAWTVTHLASGKLATPGAAGFTQLEMAMAFGSRVAAVSNWNRIDGQAPGRELGLQVMAIWNELIALDMAKTLNDRYLSSACEAHKEPKRFRSRKRV